MPFDNPHESPFGDIERLLDARNRIADPGQWIKGKFQDRDRYCIVGAVSAACGGHSGEPHPVVVRLARILAHQLLHERSILDRILLWSPEQSLITFNDQPNTHHDDVMALFDRAIGHLASKAPVRVAA